MCVCGENHLKIEPTTAGRPPDVHKNTLPCTSPADGFDQRRIGSATSCGRWLSAPSRTNSYFSAASFVSLRAAAISSLFSAGDGVADGCGSWAISGLAISRTDNTIEAAADRLRTIFRLLVGVACVAFTSRGL